MHEYHINLPKDVQLAIEIEDTPIKLHLTFKGGARYSFEYAGKPSRKARVTSGSGSQTVIPLTAARHGGGIPLVKVRHTEPGAGGASLEFIDPDGSQMP